MASFLAKIIRSLKAPHPTIDSIECFSYGASTEAASANRSTGLFENVIFLMSYMKGAIEGIGGDTKRVVAEVVGSCDDASIGDHSCERRSFTNVPTFSLPMWTSHG